METDLFKFFKQETKVSSLLNGLRTLQAMELILLLIPTYKASLETIDISIHIIIDSNALFVFNDCDSIPSTAFSYLALYD